MLIAMIAASILLPQTPTVWNAGDLSVEVDKGSGFWRILDSNSTELLRTQGIESIAYVLSKKEQLSITGMKNGRRFITELTPSTSNTVRVVTTFFSTKGSRASQLLDSYQFALPGRQLLEKGGPSPKWATPFTLAYNDQTQIAMWPDGSAFHLSLPMPAILQGGNIGYLNQTPNQAGDWAPSEESRPIPEKTSFAYFIQAKPVEDSDSMLADLLTEMWSQQSDPYRRQSYPQQVPFIIAATSTYRFSRQFAADPFGNDLPPSDPVSDSRWLTLGGHEGEPEGGEEEEEGGDEEVGKLGLPADQMETIALTSSVNALRSAVAMFSWGSARAQSGWKSHGNELIALILAASPENGFANSITIDEPDSDEVDRPAPLNSPASADEAATAYFAARFLSEFPDHPLASELQSHTLGVLNRLPDTQPSSEAAALIATIAASETMPDALRQAVAQHQLNLQTTFSVTPNNRDNLWTLEALLWLYQLNGSTYQSQIEELVAHYLTTQSLVDNRRQDRLASFGAFRSPSGEISADNPRIASIIGRLGIAMMRPEWLDRAAFALRASHALYEGAIGTVVSELVPGRELGTASPGFGNVFLNRPDPRIDFESGEGLLNAATWEIAQETNGAYIFANGAVVGVDGLANSKGNELFNSMLSNPWPFSKHFQGGIGSAKTAGNPSSEHLPAWPGISGIAIEYKDNAAYLVASPGLSLNNAEALPTGSFIVDGKKLSAVLGPTGFETKVDTAHTPAEITFTGTSGKFQLSASNPLPSGSPVRWATNTFDKWFRTGDYRWAGTPTVNAKRKTWMSTGDLGNGTEAPWMTGEYYTPWLTVTGKTLRFTADGDGDCEIDLIDEESSTILETWSPSGNSSDVEFDLRPLTGRLVKIVIRDRDEQGLLRIVDLRVTD